MNLDRLDDSKLNMRKLVGTSDEEEVHLLCKDKNICKTRSWCPEEGAPKCYFPKAHHPMLHRDESLHKRRLSAYTRSSCSSIVFTEKVTFIVIEPKSVIWLHLPGW